MAFYGYRGGVDNCYWAPYGATYDCGFAASSPCEFGESELIQCKSSAYYTDDSSATPLQLNCSVCTYSEPNLSRYEPIEYHSSYNYYESSVNPSEIIYSEPKLLQYERPPYDHCCYLPSETKFTISYSTVEFNEPEFEEYDPTPYGGGYDPAKTYGNPLPPSDITCYPRSVPQSDSMSLENFSYASIPSPYGKDDDVPTKIPKIDTKNQPPNVKNGEKIASEGADVETVDKVASEGADVETVDKVAAEGPDVETFEPSHMIPSDDSPGHEHQNGFENGTRGDYGYGSERQVTHIPYGSGLETLDLCESIFGYWPCLAKIERKKYRELCDQERRLDPWETAVDYLFGSPVVYDYENHHPHHPHHQQQGPYECYANSWL